MNICSAPNSLIWSTLLEKQTKQLSSLKKPTAQVLRAR